MAIELVMPYFKKRPFNRVLETLPSIVRGEKKLESTLKWSYKQLNSKQQEALEAMSIFHGEVPQEALLDILGKRREKIIDSLVEKNLVKFNDETGLYSIHPLIREYFYRRLTKQPEKQVNLHMKSALSVGPRLEVSGFWMEAIRQYEGGAWAAKKMRKKLELALILGELGTVEIRTGEYQSAQQHLRSSQKIFQQLKRSRDVAPLCMS